MMNARSSTAEDRRESLEGLDDLYENMDANRDHPVHLSTQDGDLLPAVRRNPLRVIGLILGLLLIVGIAVLYRYYMTRLWKEEQLHIKYMILTSELERMNCQLGKANQTQGNTTEWKRFKCTFYYISTAKKNWTESRNVCKKSGADLVMLQTKTKHDFFKELNKHGEFWIGLETKDKQKDWSKEWKWVDGSSPTFTAWKRDVNSDPEGDFKAYMGAEGAWSRTNNGSKHWICERSIY